MPRNPLRLCVGDAERTNREMAVLMHRYLGTREHPRGAVLSAYRQARLAMAQAYRQPGINRRSSAVEVLNTLERELNSTGRDAMLTATQLGSESAATQLKYYVEAGITASPSYEMPDPTILRSGWDAAVTAQIGPMRALVLTDAEEDLLLGDGEHLGALQPAPMNRAGARWIATAVATGWIVWLIGRERDDRQWVGTKFLRQAVALVDHLTTDCCLRVNGQLVPMRGKFTLTGTPRYASKLTHPPFHWWCRTAETLYREEFDDGITEAIRADADEELARRP